MRSPQIDNYIAVVILADYLEIGASTLAELSAALAAGRSAQIATQAKHRSAADLVVSGKPALCDSHGAHCRLGVVKVICECESCHLVLQPLIPEARCQLPVDSSYNTLIARKVKRFLRFRWLRATILLGCAAACRHVQFLCSCCVDWRT